VKFVPVTELERESLLPAEKEIIVTKDGKPVGILLSVTEDSYAETLAAVRQARATQAVVSMQQQSVRSGLDKLSLEEINREIAEVRARRRNEGRR
jgi:hypothetical protein